MIPEELHLRKFLFTSRKRPRPAWRAYASLVGDNGAGKSALLDGITWAVWGRARTPTATMTSSLHHGETTVEVEFIFRMPYQGGEEQRFRILRRREKPAAVRSSRCWIFKFRARQVGAR
jgi:exonuclease SbcC